MFKRYKAAKRVLALLLCGCLVFGSVNQARFKSYAVVTEIIAGSVAIAGGLAIGYLLHMLGVTAVDKAVYKSKETVIDWANEQVAKYKKWNAANKDAYKSDDLDKEFGAWTTKLKQGTLDKSSAVWSDFKSWTSSLYSAKSSAGSVVYGDSPVVGVNESFTCWESSGKSLRAVKPLSSSVNFVVICYYNAGLRMVLVSDKKASFESTVITGGGDWEVGTVSTIYSDKRDSTGLYYLEMPIKYTLDLAGAPNYAPYVGSRLEAVSTAKTWLDVGTVSNYSAGTIDYKLTGGISDVYNKSNVLDNVDIVGGVDAPTAVGAVSVPIAWPVNEDTLVDTLGGVRDGSIPWDKTLSNVGTAAVDVVGGKTYVIGNEGVTTKEYVYAKDKADAKDEEITVPDVVAPSANLGAYTIAGLEKMFPFCLPFDLIDFIKVLDAPAEAPKFTIPFKYPTRSGTATYDIVIDLSSFNSVAELLRDMECLAFIVGLIMITRSRMIRG